MQPTTSTGLFTSTSTSIDVPSTALATTSTVQPTTTTAEPDTTTAEPDTTTARPTTTTPVPTTSTPPPTTTVPSRPAVVPANMTACCDATLTFPQSPALQFFPTAWSPVNVTVTLTNGTVLAPGWADQRLSYAYDASLLALTRQGTDRLPLLSVLSANYRGVVTTHVSLVFTMYGYSANASLSLTIVDAVNISLGVRFPDPQADWAPLYRLHCSSEFQSAVFSAKTYIEAVGYVPVPSGSLYLSLTHAQFAAVSGVTVTGLAPGATDVVASWWGFTAVYQNITVLNASVVFVDAYSPPYAFTGTAGQTLPLSLYLSQLAPDSPNATGLLPFALPAPALITLSMPPSVRLSNSNDALYSVSNSAAQEYVSFIITACEGSAPGYRAPLLVNLAPGPYDLDIGADGDALALGLNSGAACRCSLVRVGAGPFQGALLVYDPLGCCKCLAGCFKGVHCNPSLLEFLSFFF